MEITLTHGGPIGMLVKASAIGILVVHLKVTGCWLPLGCVWGFGEDSASSHAARGRLTDK
jgi:hypothetical protein